MNSSFTIRDLKLPNEWIQLFRIILSIYLAWLILLTPKKPVLNDDIKSRIVFAILLFLFVQTDFLSALLLVMIYFFSFQAVLPINLENYENVITNEPTPNPNFESKIDANLKRPNPQFTDPPQSLPPKINFQFGTDKALKLL
jgi:hypothetical protein